MFANKKMKIKKIISLSLLFTTIALNSVIAKDLKPQKNIVFEIQVTCS